MTASRSEFTKSLIPPEQILWGEPLALLGEVFRQWPVSYYLPYYPSPLREFPWQKSRQLLPSQLSKPSLTLTSVITLLNAVHQPAASVASKNPFGNPILNIALNSKSSQKTWKCEKLAWQFIFSDFWNKVTPWASIHLTMILISAPSITKFADRKWEIFTFLVGIFILRSSASRLRTCQGACIRTKLSPWLLFWNIKKKERKTMYLSILEQCSAMVSSCQVQQNHSTVGNNHRE